MDSFATDPAPMRAPFGWPSLALLPNAANAWKLEPQRLRSVSTGHPLPVAVAGSSGQGGWVSFCVSTDNRDEKRVSVRLGDGSRELGVLDLRYVHSIAPFRLWLEPADFAAALEQGVLLSLTKGQTPLWIFGENLPEGAAKLEPLFLLNDAGANRSGAGALPAFFDCLASVASVQTFGWMEGCLLDAFWDLHMTTRDARWLNALDEHLSLFITNDGDLVYENPRGLPCDNAIYGIEGTLPYAILAKIDPDHPLVGRLLLPFYREHLRADGSFADTGATYTAEGSYTICYPLAVVAGLHGDAGLAQTAAAMLRHNIAALRPQGGDIWLRYYPADGSRTFRSWARGVSWYLQGLVRTLESIRGLTDTDDLFAELHSAVAWVLALQRPDGLWGCYLNDPATGADTSGSAGIAAAIGRAAWLGLLDHAPEVTPAKTLAAAARTWNGLLPYLTPDGFIGGAAQSNRGGEALQRSDYRVLSPLAMGLMGQLAAILPENVVC